jgi:thioredoxin 1
MELLSKKTFIEKIYDYENKKEWEYRGELPAIIDFYADWCGPCKFVAPILEKLASEYQGKINIYKVNTDQEQELATAFGIMTIPSLMFIPKQGQPQMTRGALSRESFVKMINDVLGVM